MLLILLMYNPGPSNTKLIFTAAHGEFCILKFRRRTVSDKLLLCEQTMSQYQTVKYTQVRLKALRPSSGQVT